MAFYEKNIITCVEIGTSKICALHGTCDKAGNPVILGFGQTSPEGSVCKSDIVDYQTVTNALEKALGDADQSAGRDFERKSVYCVLNGPGIFSRQGEGNAGSGAFEFIRLLFPAGLLPDQTESAGVPGKPSRRISPHYFR